MNTRRKLILGIPLAVLALSAGIATSVWRVAPESAQNSAVEHLFKLGFPDADGKVTDLASLRGQPLVINFWATWCAPCIEEMPELSEINDKYSPRGVTMLGFGIDSAPNIKRFEKRLSVSYPLLVLGAAGIELTRQLGNAAGALPFTVIIGRDGTVIEQVVGRIRKEQLEQAIARAF